MLDLDRLERVRLRGRPVGQLIVGNLGLALDYRFPKKTEIVLEGAAEHIPCKGGVFLAMNHTDRYNYWPFQYAMYRAGLPFTATWVKGKYYENRLVGAFMDSMNNIPLPSRGYVIATEFRKRAGRPPTNAEYRVLRDLVDGKKTPSEALGVSSGDLAAFIAPEGGPEHFLARFDALFDRMLHRVVDLNRQAIEELGLNVLVFPEGTRSQRLGKGLNGLAQITQYLGAPIVPVGCNGSDRLYPGNSPFSKGGRVTYRVGPPLLVDGPELASLRVPRSDVLPFSKEAAARYGQRYDVITRVVMDRINDLLDPAYRRTEDEATLAEQGVGRFL
ncbi:MAG TPA: lysophospholipid acyltransferase family protein [Polyangiaceae bacterium]|nr:lysophospholipid acyltransferase family protein [Polyangiaceae bacterium]